MRLLLYAYVIAILAVFFVYWLFGINFIWLEGFLSVLLIARIMPKATKIQVVIALFLVVSAVIMAFYGSENPAEVISLFVMLTLGLPGILVYASTTILFNGVGAVQTVTIVPLAVMGIVLIIHLLRYVIDKVAIPTTLFPKFDYGPVLLDTIMILIMAYLVFMYSSNLLSIIQSAISYFAHSVL